ncbi:MAG: glycosyltransferase family 39 protein [Candidatus Omnitrophica bacterium]|nr:glycosyltransferase family 39 protein [Candidatus Omnitrophota bacterium]
MKNSKKTIISWEKPSVQLALLAVIMTLGTFLFAAAAYIATKNHFPSSWLEIWNRWDTVHYLKIAREGYSTEGSKIPIVFFPLYPILINFAAFFTHHHLFSSLLISNAAYVGVVIYFYRLARMDYPEEISLRTVLYLSVFPSAYFLHAGYTESLFILFTLGCFYHARRNEWAVCVLFGVLATATRITGFCLAIAILIEYFTQRNWQWKKIDKKIFLLFLIPLGVLSYLWINYYYFQSPFAFLEISKAQWGKTIYFPWKGLVHAIESLQWRSPSELVTVSITELIFALGSLLLCLWALLRLRISYGFFAITSWLVITSTSYWLSIPRYSLSIFPIFIALAVLVRNRMLHTLLVMLSGMLYGFFLLRFVTGQWAF